MTAKHFTVLLDSFAIVKYWRLKICNQLTRRLHTMTIEIELILTFLNNIAQCVPSPEDESKFKILHSFNFAFLGRVSLKNTPLNPYSDNFLAVSIISCRFQGVYQLCHSEFIIASYASIFCDGFQLHYRMIVHFYS